MLCDDCYYIMQSVFMLSLTYDKSEKGIAYPNYKKQ